MASADSWWSPSSPSWWSSETAEPVKEPAGLPEERADAPDEAVAAARWARRPSLTPIATAVNLVDDAVPASPAPRRRRSKPDSGSTKALLAQNRRAIETLREAAAIVLQAHARSRVDV